MNQPGQTLDVLDRILEENPFNRSVSASQFRRQVQVSSGHCRGAFEIGVATRPEEMLEHFSLRYQSDLSQRYVEPSNPFEQELEYDDHDRSSALFLARGVESGQLNGVARLAFDQAGQLPMDAYWSLDGLRERIGYYEEPDLTMAEFSRLISFPTRQKELNRALIRAVFEFAVEQGVDYIVGAGRCDIRHYYDKWGFREVEPGAQIDPSLLGGVRCSPVPLYPHYMHTSEIRWEKI